ncbi:MAG TPA: hypothetical protein VFR24_05365 [Candidatus Angelobacter sp.]|nr:hypothetical protein [Candidatus Angelobacter sp.]
MSAPVPFLPTVLETIHELLTTRTIPALSGEEMEALCSHLFALRDRDQRIAIAEIAYNNHDDPQAMNIFLACTMPMAEGMAKRKAERVFTNPSDWQIEAMYDGAVSFLLEMFKIHRPLRPFVSNPFQRYLIITILHGAMNPFRIRQEHWGIQGVEDVTKVYRIQGRYQNRAERELITRDLLEQVTTFPHLMEEQARVLKTIAALGPEKALRQTNYYRDDSDESQRKHIRRRRSILNLNGIADAMGVKKQKVKNLLKDTRQILRDSFNQDGRLFAS